MKEQKTRASFIAPIELFRKKTESLLGLYDHILVKSILLKKKGVEFPFLTEIQLVVDSAVYPPPQQNLPITKNIKVIDCKMPIDKFPQIVEGLLKRKLILGTTICDFYPVGYKRLRSWFFDKRHPEFPLAQTSMIGLKIFSERPNDIRQTESASTYDWELRAADFPYHSLDLLIVYLGFSNRTYRRMFSPLIDVYALAPVRFNYGENTYFISDNHFMMQVVLPSSVKIEQLKLGVNVYGNKPIRRYCIDLSGVSEMLSEGVYRLKIPSDGFTAGDFYLIYDGDCFSHLNISDWKRDNPRILCHDYFDGELKIFNNWLVSAHDKPHNLEHAVSTLFYMLGYYSENLALFQLRGEVDVIAFHPTSNKMILAECTTSSPNISNKLAKLIGKSRGMTEYFRSRNEILPEMIPSIITSKKRDILAPSEITEAGINRIAIITRENLQEMIIMAQRRATPDEVYEYILSCIPSNVLEEAKKSATI